MGEWSRDGQGRLREDALRERLVKMVCSGHDNCFVASRQAPDRAANAERHCVEQRLGSDLNVLREGEVGVPVRVPENEDPLLGLVAEEYREGLLVRWLERASPAATLPRHHDLDLGLERMSPARR